MNTLDQTASDVSPSVAMFQMVRGFWVSRAIYVAAQLGLADLLKNGPKSSEQLAQATAMHPPSIYRLMRVLASVGVFAQDEQGRFGLTPVGTTLQTDVPGSLRAWILLQLGEQRYRVGGAVLHTMRTGEIAFNHVFGTGYWEYVAQHFEDAKIFDDAMANLIRLNHAAVLSSYSFSTIDKIVDVGGGDGSLIVALLQGNPKMNGVLFDLPHVTEKAKKRLADADLAGRCEIVGGDVFASVPAGGDVYILSQVMNGFDDDRALAILKNCHGAMPHNAKLLLVQRVLPDRMEPSIAVQALVLSDFNMMMMNGGRERTETEYRTLLAAAGFQVTKIIPTQSESTLIECARA